MSTQTQSSPSASAAPKDAHAKALAINLSNIIYGTFAEIGAGQEVARWFLRVGGASGTVAQTISAYDKTFSDETYGGGTRYVSSERLSAMLEREYNLLLNRLGAARGDRTRFFVFADTVATRNYRGDNEQHGWVGIRFQAEPAQGPNNILVHVNLNDPSAAQQQEALGLLGVNLVYAAFHQRGSDSEFLAGLFDGLSIDRLEIDVIELSGPAFAGIDPRGWCLSALKRGMAHAIAFQPQSAGVVEPASVLRKRPLIIERGRFDRAERFQTDMLEASEKQLRAEAGAESRQPGIVLEMTIHHAGGTQVAAETDLLQRVQQAAARGIVVVSDYPQTYKLVHYLRRHTAEPVRLVVGVAGLAQLLHAADYQELPGSLLEGIGRFLATNVKVYAYPMSAEIFAQILGSSMPDMVRAAPSTGMVTADDLHPHPPLHHLYRYLRESGSVVPLAV